MLKLVTMCLSVAFLTSCMSTENTEDKTTVVDLDMKMGISQIEYDIGQMRVCIDRALYTITDPTFASMSKTTSIAQSEPYLVMDIIRAIRGDMEYQVDSKEECYTIARVYDNNRGTWVFRLIKIPTSYLTNQGMSNGIVYK